MRTRDGVGAGRGGRPPRRRGSPGAERPKLRTEFAFELPRGYVDDAGTVHRSGVMRLATARDELIPLRDDRVRENSAFLTVVLLARVVTRHRRRSPTCTPASSRTCSPRTWRSCRTCTAGSTARATPGRGVACPECRHGFVVDVAGGRLGES